MLVMLLMLRSFDLSMFLPYLLALFWFWFSWDLRMMKPADG